MKSSRDVEELINRCDEIIELGKQALSGILPSSSHRSFNTFRSSSLSFIAMTYGNDHTYYTQFLERVQYERKEDAQIGMGILEAIRGEIEGGWLTSTRSLISAEIFSDYVEMASHLNKERYKDASAVIIGSTLEAHLRHLCVQNGVTTEIQRNGDLVPKKADLINADLSKANVYSKLDQKMITA